MGLALFQSQHCTSLCGLVDLLTSHCLVEVHFMSVKLVDLDDNCRQQQVNDGCFPSIEETPTQAITLTVPTLANAARQICAVPGPLKAEAVRKTIYDPVSPECPATILRTLPNATLYLDADSASLLDRK